jgi:plastocyanin
MGAVRSSQPSTRRPVASSLAAVVLGGTALLAGACGESRDAGVQIGMRDLQFQPRQASLRVGQRVEWRNDEDAPHNIVATAGARFRSKTVGRSDTFGFTPGRAGAVRYVCTLHPGMTGALRVVG